MKIFTTSIFVVIVSLLSNYALAETSEQVYGWQLMTQQERAEHRQKMQGFNTFEERETYRLEHHKLMQERAREQGMNLPDVPLPQGRGIGGGQGMGPGGMGGGKR